MEQIDEADEDAKAAAAAAEATIAAMHAHDRQQLQEQQQQMELLVEQLQQKVHELERDASLKLQQQEELTRMCAQVGESCLGRQAFNASMLAALAFLFQHWLGCMRMGDCMAAPHPLPAIIVLTAPS